MDTRSRARPAATEPSVRWKPATAAPAAPVDFVRSLQNGRLGRALVRFRELPRPSLPRSVRDLVRGRPVLDVAPSGAVADAARPDAGSGRFGRIGFVLAVVVPTLMTGFYLAFIASDQYTAEMRFAVRGSVEALAGAEEWGQFGFLIKLNNNQESQLLATFIGSRGMIERIAPKLDLAAIYNRPKLDLWARLGSDRTLEELERYWSRMVEASVEAISGIVTVEVRAFTPADALAIAQAIRAESEELLNELSDRMRRDTMAFAEQRLVADAAHLSAVGTSFQRYRDEQGVIDASSAAKSAVDTLAELRKERIRRATELTAARRSLQADAPTLQHLAKRIAVADATIEGFQQRLVSAPNADTGPGASPEQRLKYDWLSVKNEMAEQRVKSAETSLDRARMDLDRQQIFLSVFSPPGLPERSSFPRRKRTLAMVLFAGFVLWGLGMLVVTAVREHDC